MQTVMTERQLSIAPFDTRTGTLKELSTFQRDCLKHAYLGLFQPRQRSVVADERREQLVRLFLEGLSRLEP